MSDATTTTSTTAAPGGLSDEQKGLDEELAETGVVPEGYAYTPYAGEPFQKVDAEGNPVDKE